MKQSNVTAAMTSAFSNGGFQDRLTCTKLQKAALTQIHGIRPDQKQNVTEHMLHRVAMAEKHYRYKE